jgi:hypothetical protein
VISDWSEACDEQAEVRDKFERGTPVDRVWWGGSLPRRRLGGGGLLKDRKVSQGYYSYTCFKRLLRLETCRAVTQGGPRLGTFVDVSYKNVSGTV